ncbi:MAG TPA: hypothetical protein VFK27_00105 [Bacillales bacterium]|nr:hypothetical protein [Bacillales bacterium]
MADFTVSDTELGAAPLFACRYDQRFSYYTYTPEGYDRHGKKNYPLVAAVHGTERAAESYRDAFIDFAEEFQVVVLAPLFPAGIIDFGDLDAYKFMKIHGIRFDHVLLAMIDEAAGKYRIAKDKFLLHGFSGGGQFAHRFFCLHPDRLAAVSIGAPGRITYLDDAKKWPFGTADFYEQFGTGLNLKSMREVPVQVIVGEQDTEELNDQSHTSGFAAGFSGGSTRLARAETLAANYERHGITVKFDQVPGVAHEGFQVLPAVKTFFSGILA